MRAFLLALISCGCSTTVATADAAIDGAADSGPDLCDLGAYFDAGGAGHACPYVSPRLCFHNPTDCKATGCKCAATPMGPQWTCTADLTCKDSGASDGGDDASSADAASDASSDASGD